MPKQKVFSFIIGFLILFFVYHFPEFFSAFWIMAAFKVGFLIVAFVLARTQGWKGLGGYGLPLTSKWANLIIGLPVGLLFFSLSLFVSVQLGYEQIVTFDAVPNIISQLPMLLLMTAIPSVAEDILTRGYLYAHLQFLKPYSWIFLSSAIYVLNHIWRLNDGAAVVTYLFILGLVLAFAVWMTKSLWLAFGIHWGANIAFELTHTAIHTKSLVAHNGSVWLLAGSWALLLIILIAFNITKISPGSAGNS